MPKIKPVLRWAQYLFLAAGLAALGWCAFVWMEAKLYQRRQEKELSELQKFAATAPKPSAKPPVFAAVPKVPPEGALIGRIEIPRVGVSAIVAQGVDTRTLRRGVGHIPGTALPEETGNVAVAGHRDTFFRGLRNIRRDDTIQLTTADATYEYKVESTKVVDPSDIRVLDPSTRPVLTLVTCYPFSYIGAAPKRFIVRAVRVAREAAVADRGNPRSDPGKPAANSP
jgi:sortase A